MKKIGLGILMLIAQAVLAGGGGETETIFGYIADDEGITFQVFSGGCTQKEHFNLQKFECGKGECNTELLLTRTEPDWCKAYIPMGVPVRYTWKEIPVKPEDRSVIVVNPIKPEIDVTLIEK